MLKPVSYVLLIVGTTLMLQFQSCSSEMETELDDSFHLVYSGDVYIADSIETELGQDLIIKPGTTVTFGPDALLTLNGSLIAIGTPDSIIHFRGDDATLDQLILKARWETELLELQYVEINNGLVRSTARQNKLRHVTFINTKANQWNSALFRLWYGYMDIQHCTLQGNNTGEGILAHDMIEPVVKWCTFDQVPDAVEYTDSHYGIISENIFTNNADDAIDQNSCIGTIIRNNEFYNVKHRALEIGSENYDSSRDIVVHNNLFVNCSIGVNLKESSSAVVTNATFYSTDNALELLTPADSSNVSSVIMSQSILVDCPTSVLTDARSLSSISNSISNTEPLEGDNNVFTDVQVTMEENGNINVVADQYPVGFDIETVGYQQ